jgi:hypothetical protein
MNVRAIAVLLMTALFFLQGIVSIGTPISGGSGDLTTFEIVEDPAPWVDTFEDLTGVYIPPNGLVGVRRPSRAPPATGTTWWSWTPRSRARAR